MNSCFVSFTFLCFKSDMFLSDSSASLYLFHLFWRANQLKTENRRRFASKVGHLWYFMGLSCKINLRGESLPVLPLRNQPALFRQGEGR